MRLRYLAAGLAAAGSVAGLAVVASGAAPKTPPGLAEAALWAPRAAVLAPAEASAPVLADVRPDPVPVVRAPVLSAVPALAQSDAPPPAMKPPLVIATRDIAPGETLDAILVEAGFAAPDRAEIALALGVEFDLRRLRPGHRVTTSVTSDGAPRRVTLEVDDGVRIEATFGDRVAIRVVTPEPDEVILAGEARIDSSLFAALEDAGLPARFAVDLAQMLGGTVDFRRDLSGGETLRLMWREARVGDEIIGQPELTFAALDLGDTLFEIVWPEDGSGRAAIFRDGEMRRVFAQPVEGARLSSVFGQRKHPIYGNVRMHTGVDFAAARGTPVYATAPGRIRFIGRRGGYGRVVEIAHGSETMTRYAHLSAVPDGLGVGDRVAAGDVIGNVGATGTATGPNLHYEVRVDGRPTDPLSDERLAEAAKRDAEGGTALARLNYARALFEEHLASVLATNTNGRL